MTDTVMLGQLGETAISASLANQPYFIFYLMLCGLSGGSIVLTAQYWGKQDTASISKVTGIALRFFHPSGRRGGAPLSAFFPRRSWAFTPTSPTS